jgi:hypothetical protein
MPRELKIIPVLNGWIVEAGCQKCVFGDLTQLCLAIGDYYTDPDAIEAKFLLNAKNKIEGPRPPESSPAAERRIQPADHNIGSIPQAPQEIRRQGFCP